LAKSDSRDGGGTVADFARFLWIVFQAFFPAALRLALGGDFWLVDFLARFVAFPSKMAPRSSCAVQKPREARVTYCRKRNLPAGTTSASALKVSRP
jgi:hypothetical protein